MLEFAKMVGPVGPIDQNEARTSILKASAGPDDRCKNSRCSAFLSVISCTATNSNMCLHRSSDVPAANFRYWFPVINKLKPMETKVPIYTWPAKFVHGKQLAIEILDGDNKY